MNKSVLIECVSSFCAYLISPLLPFYWNPCIDFQVDDWNPLFSFYFYQENEILRTSNWIQNESNCIVHLNLAMLHDQKFHVCLHNNQNVCDYIACNINTNINSTPSIRWNLTFLNTSFGDIFWHLCKYSAERCLISIYSMLFMGCSIFIGWDFGGWNWSSWEYMRDTWERRDNEIYSMHSQCVRWYGKHISIGAVCMEMSCKCSWVMMLNFKYALPSIWIHIGLKNVLICQNSIESERISNWLVHHTCQNKSIKKNPHELNTLWSLHTHTHTRANSLALALPTMNDWMLIV